MYEKVVERTAIAKYGRSHTNRHKVDRHRQGFRGGANAGTYAKTQRPLRSPAQDRRKNDAGNIGLLKKSMYATRDAVSNWECDWQNHLQRWDSNLGQSSKYLFHHKGNRMSGMTHGDHFVVTGPESKYPIETKNISHGSAENINALNRRVPWREGWCTRMTQDMWMCL